MRILLVPVKFDNHFCNDDFSKFFIKSTLNHYQNKHVPVYSYIY